MTRTLTIAIAGSGIGAEHAAAYAALPDQFRIGAIIDRNVERASALASHYGVELVLKSIADLAPYSSEIDVLDICLPPQAHANAIEAGLEFGHHIVCEKPLLDSVGAIDRLILQSERAGRMVMPIFQYRFGAGFRRFMNYVETGLAGKIRQIAIEVHWSRDQTYFGQAWRRTRAGAFGGVLASQAIHHLDLAYLVAGPFSKVSARARNEAFGLEVEDSAVAWLESASGTMVSLSATLSAIGNRSRLTFLCDDLVAHSSEEAYDPAQEPWAFQWRDGRETIPEARHAKPSGYAYQFKQLHQAIVLGKPLPVTLTDARHMTQTLAALYRSAAQQGIPCEVSLTSDFSQEEWPVLFQPATAAM